MRDELLGYFQSMTSFAEKHVFTRGSNQVRITSSCSIEEIIECGNLGLKGLAFFVPVLILKGKLMLSSTLYVQTLKLSTLEFHGN